MSQAQLSLDLSAVSRLLQSAKTSLQDKQANQTSELPKQNWVPKIPHLLGSACNLPSYFQQKNVPCVKKDELVSNVPSYVDESSSIEEPTTLNPHVPAPGITKKKKAVKDTAGGDWFDMPATELTESVKRDIQLLKMRNVLDPKRHYRRENAKQMPKYFQTGTVIEGPQDYFSSRIPTRERKSTITDELVNDTERRGYFKKKYLEIQKSKMSGRKGQYKKLKERRKPSYLK
ncbi:rRNA processing protein Fcf2 [Schizosaccharomyces cryophilus OY26]|uniref:rRNA processing protein Fcf2 n=1 Tax=Schizosaccharomyces cryophilus (strain OY26 / ATCC MYA-4695 / CBS 11777 / NBRC 106824 / NRRL Y48691) TaxID=653667 RepID=S9X8E1_SCHCR|nr:rRNA processing protein Fcf2 [Schizosaccharomyces cryophilus OY26]EPY53382.1 rRNA processing protein Fcf2 [Schizosaccharomyces cryophilus OY26]